MTPSVFALKKSEEVRQYGLEAKFCPYIIICSHRQGLIGSCERKTPADRQSQAVSGSLSPTIKRPVGIHFFLDLKISASSMPTMGKQSQITNFGWSLDGRV